MFNGSTNRLSETDTFFNFDFSMRKCHFLIQKKHFGTLLTYTTLWIYGEKTIVDDYREKTIAIQIARSMKLID